MRDFFGEFEEDDGVSYGYDLFNKKCRYCGQKGLGWHLRDEGWRLVDPERNVHSCNATRAVIAADREKNKCQH